MKIAIIVVFGAYLSIAGGARAEVMECRAKVALNRVYDVHLDTESKLVKVVTDNGYRYEGLTSYAFSPRTGNGNYFLATGFGSGIDLELEAGGSQRVAMCLAVNECYLCKRK